MTAGRKPRPAHLRVIENNPGKRPLPETKVELSSKIRMPNGMQPEAKKIWRYTIDHLPTGMTKEIDVIALRTYCEAVAEYDMACKKLQAGYIVASKTGTARPSPWNKIRNEAWQRLYKLSAEFGFTPSARTRLGMMDVESGDDDDLS